MWRRRFNEEGIEGLNDRSIVPHHQPTKTDPEVIEKILWLRQQYHFGPQKISMYLARHHDVIISPSGIWRILHKLGLAQRHGGARDPRTIAPLHTPTPPKPCIKITHTEFATGSIPPNQR